MNQINFFEAMRAAFDLEGIITVVFTVFRANCLDEIDDNAVRPLLMLAFNRNYLFQQSLSRQKGTRTNKEYAAERHALWQEEANKIWAEHPRWSKTCMQANAAVVNKADKTRIKKQARQLRQLESELRRKDKALAETAALLVLQKKVQEIWGDPEDEKLSYGRGREVTACIDEACAAGARVSEACRVVEISPRTLQRWYNEIHRFNVFPSLRLPFPVHPKLSKSLPSNISL